MGIMCGPGLKTVVEKPDQVWAHAPGGPVKVGTAPGALPASVCTGEAGLKDPPSVKALLTCTFLVTPVLPFFPEGLC